VSLISINDGFIFRIFEENPTFNICLQDRIAPICPWGSAPNPKVFKAWRLL